MLRKHEGTSFHGTEPLASELSLGERKVDWKPILCYVYESSKHMYDVLSYGRIELCRPEVSLSAN